MVQELQLQLQYTYIPKKFHTATAKQPLTPSVGQKLQLQLHFKAEASIARQPLPPSNSKYGEKITITVTP